MRFQELFLQSIKRLNDPQRTLEIELIILDTFNITRSQFWIKKDKEISENNKLKKFYSNLNRLLDGEPLFYIRKKKEFFSREFYINKYVLIPRPETEILVEKAINVINRNDLVLDIGSGSGNIAITLALETKCQVWACEKSRRAIRVLLNNISLFQQEGKVKAVLTNLFPDKPKYFSVIVSNPPYLSIEEWKKLPDSIKSYEPKGALLAGEKGTELLEKIIQLSAIRLKKNGTLLLEIGAGQNERIESCLQNSGFNKIFWYKDYQNICRVVSACF